MLRMPAAPSSSPESRPASGTKAQRAQDAHADVFAPPLDKQHAAPPGRVDGYNVLFVGNIAWEVHKPAVEELFRSFAPKFVRMFDDPATSRHRGFAHVHFADEASVDKCAPPAELPLLLL